jgi:hypothetical protein
MTNKRRKVWKIVSRKPLSVKQMGLDTMHISLNLKDILVFSLLKNKKKSPLTPENKAN